MQSSTPYHQLRIAVAQPLAVPGDIPENLKRIEDLARQASERGADLALFSECAITGYDLKNAGVHSAIAADSPAIDSLADISHKLGIAIVAGFYEQAAEGVYNSAAACKPDGSRIIQRKHNIIDHEAACTPVLCGPRERTMFDLNGVQCAILICADHGIEGIYEEVAAKGCQLVLGPTAGQGSADIAFPLAQLLAGERLAEYVAAEQTVCFPTGAIERCITLRMAIAATNQCGYDKETGYFHPGHSAILDWNGEIAALIPGRYCPEHLHPDMAIGLVHVASD